MKRIILLALAVSICPPAVLADEGMWPYNHIPFEALQEKYGFVADQEFFDKLRLASVRYNNGGSGSFVSAKGLTMTNHHVASDCIRKLSTPEKDLMQTGFSATRASSELKCPDLELNVLVEMETVTGRVNSGLRPDMSDQQRFEAQKAASADIEKECTETSGNRCDVVNLYSGGIFDLYQYKKYTDVRLVFAPEYEAAFFGGDPDNFTYPRFCLDVAFLRVYEDGEPVTPEAHLSWSAGGSKEGDLVFVSGHPGSTKRLLTVDQLAMERDRRIPFMLDWLGGMREALRSFGHGGGETERLARDELFRIDNSLKAYTGMLSGLREQDLMRQKADAETALRAKVDEDADLKQRYAEAWEALSAASRIKAEIYEEYRLAEQLGFYSRLFEIARRLYRLSEELPKDNSVRLPEYRDSALDSLYLRLYSEAPIYAQAETVKLAQSLRFLRDRLGFDHPLVEASLGEGHPDTVAKRLVQRTRLDDVEFRKELGADGASKAAASEDSMMVLARAVDQYARPIRKRYEDEVEAAENAQGSRIAQARFAVEGSGVYPDATFTLRISLGTVKGYLEGRQRIAPFTTLGGLFDKVTGEDPYVLPKRFEQRKRRVKLDTPYNLVSTNDITGGNSGSPLINIRGEVVGIIFDGNIHSLSNDFLYSDRQARAVSVDSRGIVEALKNIYRATTLVKELTAAPAP